MKPYMTNPEEQFEVLNQALLFKTQTPCCATYCDNCPYSPKNKGEIRGPENWNKKVQGLVAMISVENSPNKDFGKNPNAAEIIERLKKGVATRDDVKLYTINN